VNVVRQKNETELAAVVGKAKAKIITTYFNTGH
jgi:hypothetical protein